MEFGSAGADRGLLKEFEAIIAVVIGGALLTGGYGSVIGAALGALIFGVVQQGLFFAGVESSLFSRVSRLDTSYGGDFEHLYSPFDYGRALRCRNR